MEATPTPVLHILAMMRLIKKKLYFAVAHYFRVFASIQLALWKPRIIAITGSSGKTTLLHLIESQLKGRARYSHHANSTYGIPFDLLGLRRTKLIPSEWIRLFLAAPFRAFKKPYQEPIYVVEVDCDRPSEGEFLGTFLKPEVTLWLNTGNTHSTNFDTSVQQGKGTDVENAIAYEFGYVLQHTTDLAIVNGDIQRMTNQFSRFQGRIEMVKQSQLHHYELSEIGTVFEIDKTLYRINGFLPKESFYSVAMTRLLIEYLGLPFDESFTGFSLPPGRSSILRGIKNTTLIDSSYNATPDGMSAMLEAFDRYPARNKWLVLGDMIELGSQEQNEHEKLAERIASIETSQVVLIGPRIAKYTYPKLVSLIGNSDTIVPFEFPKEALDYILEHLQGGECILFKGARFLEGIIEQVVLDKSDVHKLCRREQIWQLRRKQWGL